jgi:hypothetical protein
LAVFDPYFFKLGEKSGENMNINKLNLLTGNKLEVFFIQFIFIVATITTISVAYSVSANQNSEREFIGRTNEGERIFLIPSTVRLVNSGEDVDFDYVLENQTNKRVNRASTGSCNYQTGKVDDSRNDEAGTTGYEWFVGEQNGKKVTINPHSADIKADLIIMNLKNKSL